MHHIMAKALAIGLCIKIIGTTYTFVVQSLDRKIQALKMKIEMMKSKIELQ